MLRRAANASVKNELERVQGRRNTTPGRTSRDALLSQFRQARRRLGTTVPR